MGVTLKKQVLSIGFFHLGGGGGGGGAGVFLWTASKVKSLAHASHFPRFILLISFSDTLLVVIAM